MYRWRDCYSDEHYFATLLATKNLDHETDCEGQSMHVDWSFGGEHPRSYSVRETTSSRYVILWLHNLTIGKNAVEFEPINGCA